MKQAIKCVNSMLIGIINRTIVGSIFVTTLCASEMIDSRIRLDVTENGKLQAALNLGDFGLGKHALGPLTAVFESANAGGGPDALLPGWRIPLLEACVFKLSEDKIQLNMPDEKISTLRVSSHSKELFESNSYEANLKGINKLTVTSLDSSPIALFEGGRLSIFHVDEESSLAWNYENGRCSTVKNQSGLHIINVLEAPRKIKFTGESDSQISWQLLSAGKLGVLPAVTGFSSSDGETLKFKNRLDGKILSVDVFNPSGVKIGGYSYDIVSGNVHSIGNTRYEIEEVRGYESPRVTQIIGDERVVLFNPKKSEGYVFKTLLPDGTIKEKIYTKTLAGARLKKVSLIKKEKKETIYLAFFDENGILLRDQSKEIERRFIGNSVFVYKNKKLVNKY